MMQRITVATLAGVAADAAVALFEKWRSDSDPTAVDRFAMALRENQLRLPIVYFAEWVDRWLMGDDIFDADPIQGVAFQATVWSSAQALARGGRCRNQFQEQLWYSARLLEAATAWDALTHRLYVVVLREVIHVSTGDDEVLASMNSLPEWLSALE